MHRSLRLTTLWLLFSCTAEQPNFKAVTCEENAQIDNPNLRRIFKPCRSFLYRAQYWDAERNLLSDELIRVDVPGRAWEYQPESQDEIVIQYQYRPEEVEKLETYSLNPELTFWTTETTTGIIETADRVWMHPFRSNQYTFTEVAPFPEVHLPLSPGQRWSGNLHIHDGWGVWENSVLHDEYEVVNYDTLDSPLGQLNTWHIFSYTTAEFGTSTQDIWFHEDYGFVKMLVENYRNQLLQFELIEVEES